MIQPDFAAIEKSAQKPPKKSIPSLLFPLPAEHDVRTQHGYHISLPKVAGADTLRPLLRSGKTPVLAWNTPAQLRARRSAAGCFFILHPFKRGRESLGCGG